MCVRAEKLFEPQSLGQTKFGRKLRNGTLCWCHKHEMLSTLLFYYHSTQEHSSYCKLTNKPENKGKPPHESSL
jgi:hypothetical protein